MPEGATWDNLMYEINFMAQVHEGIADAEAGRVITTEELLQRMESWRK
jgi:predicted transcriptional regulator